MSDAGDSVTSSRAERFRRVDAVFDAVLDLPAEEQLAYIDRTCGADAELHRDVLELLRAYHASEGFLQWPAVDMIARILASNAALAEAAPERLGPFRVLHEIGRGGMGRVFLGERDDGQFEQRVALKLIQHAAPGIVQRFMEERRILAMLEHPGIARLIDGGIAENGAPYFAMELVAGEPIDRYAEAHALPLARRLELFATVCDAVAYAHRQLIVHRDLKPSNILVTADGQVKLLDFGIAKLLDAQGADADATRTEFKVLTPEFAAPEQVRGTPVSTATDVYSLGVLLYLLLTGERPYDIRGRTPAEVDRIVCVEDPPIPSNRVAPARQRALRGDLDLIAMKALRKEPDQRYASVQDLAEDVRRHLSGHPVGARRPTLGYRASRFAKRHGLSLAAATLFVLLIGAYAVSMTIQRARVERALDEATIGEQKAEQVTEFMLGLFEASDRGQAFADSLTARALLDRGIARAREQVGQPEVRAQMLDAVGRVHMQLGQYEPARAVFEEALAARREVLAEDHVDIATSLANVADAMSRLGDSEGAVRLREQALAIRRSSLGKLHPATLESIYWQAHDMHAAGGAAAAEPYFDEWIAAVSAQPPAMTEERATQYFNLAALLQYGRGDRESAERLMRMGLAIRREIFGDGHVSVARAQSDLSALHLDAGRLEEAEQAAREAVGILRPLYPDGHPALADAIRSLAIVLHRRQRWAEAEQLYLEQEAMVRRIYGVDHRSYAIANEDLGMLLRRRGLYTRAEPYLRTAVQTYRRVAGEQSLLTRRAEALLGDVLRRNGHAAEAEPLLLAAHAAFSERRMHGFDFALRIAIESLAELRESQGRADDAARYRALLTSTGVR
ncbi:MAG TPA: serine/threonine-protein kinase [Longimicrobiales bacterium]